MLDLFQWFTIWFSFYILQDRILIPKNFSFKNNRIVIVTLAGIYIFIVILVFQVNIFPIQLTQLITILSVVPLLHAIFLPTQKFIYKQSKNFDFRKISPILGRFTEIGFQQIMLNVLVNNVYNQSNNSIVLSGFTFSISHLPILIQRRLTLGWRIFVVATALIGGITFSWIILNIFNGWFWSYLTHLLFYFILGITTGESDQMLP